MKKTPHVYVGKEITYDNTGIVRGFAAVCTFGMTETAWADRLGNVRFVEKQKRIDNATNVCRDGRHLYFLVILDIRK